MSQTRPPPWPEVYSLKDIRAIADAIGVPASLVAGKAGMFNAAAGWYRCGVRTKKHRRLQPSVMARRLDEVRNLADRLFDKLEDRDVAAAIEGEMPGNWRDMSDLRDRLHRLTAWAEEAKATEKRFAAITSIPAAKEGGRSPRNYDGAADRWLAHMSEIYRDLTGREPAMSVDNETEIACGPLSKFLEAAGRPLGIETGSDAWRARLRRLKDFGRRLAESTT